MNVTTGKIENYTYHSMNYIQQGWQCPICKKVLAPFMTYCPFCPEDVKWTCTTSTKGETDE